MKLIPTTEAETIIQSQKLILKEEIIELSQSADRVLAENIFTDRPFPAFDQVRMDGIAIVYEAFDSGQRSFNIEGIQAAGESQKSLSNTLNCYEVMTGAILPQNSDTVIRYEDLTIENGKARINLEELIKGQNVQLEGSYLSTNKLILAKGARIQAPETGILASVGQTMVKVYELPKVCIITTGDELVDIHEVPEKHQIRRSNGYTLKYHLDKMGLKCDLLHIPDDKKKLSQQIQECLTDYKVLLFSGAVSKGKFDYLPGVLSDLGVQCHFHGVKQRPGKPFWFGSSEKTVVFAFPGNPISGFMCFNKYFKPWVNGQIFKDKPENLYARLEKDVSFKANLDYFCQISLTQEKNGAYLANPIEGKGSGDLTNLINVDGFLQLPSHKTEFLKGELYPVYLFREK